MGNKGTLIDKMKKGFQSISDELNRNKWDASQVNLALFADDDPNRPVAPVQTADPELKDFENQIRFRNQNSGGVGNVALAPAPDMDMSGRPRVKGLNAGNNSEKTVETAAEPKTEMPSYVAPVFRSRFSGPQAPGADKKDGLVSLADLPKVDPSQSISNIAPPPPLSESITPTVETSMGSHTLLKTHISKKVSVARSTSKTSLPNEKASEAFLSNMNQSIPVGAPVSAPVSAPLIPPAAVVTPAPAAPANTGYVASLVPAASPSVPVTAAVTEPVIQASPICSNTIPAPMPEAERIPSVAKESAKSNAKYDTLSSAAEVKEETPSPVPEVTETEAVSDEQLDRCYYVRIRHTKLYPEKGSFVIMRDCDHSYVWTDEQDESEKPDYNICPNCKKPVGWTDVDMD